MGRRLPNLAKTVLAGVMGAALAFNANAGSPPKNPHLADSSFPLPHGNSAQTTSAPQAGPIDPDTKFLSLFTDTITYTASGPFQFGSYTSSEYSDGRRVMWSSGADRVVKWDHDSLDVIAQWKLPPRTYHNAGQGEKHINLMNVLPLPIKFIYMLTELTPLLIDLAGIYSMIDSEGFFYVGGTLPTGEQGITVYGDMETDNADSMIEVKEQWALPPEVSGSLVGINMTFDGRVVLITEEGWVLVVSRDIGTDIDGNSTITLGNDYAFNQLITDPGEDPTFCSGAGYCWVRNAYAVDEDGGIYVASRDHMHKVIWTGTEVSTDEADGAWRAQYSNDLGNGTGATPSLMGFGDDEDKFVVFTDGNELMNVTLMWRNEIPDGWVPPAGAASDRIAGLAPADMGGTQEKVQTEQSVVISGYGALVVNNEPRNIPPQLGAIDPRINALIVGFLGNEPLLQPYGLQKFEWDPVNDTFAEAWTNNDVSSLNGVPIVSDASETVYTVGARNGLYTVEALNWVDGAETFHWFVGGNRFNSLYSGILLNENGYIHYNTLWGKALMLHDQGIQIPIPEQLESQLQTLLETDPQQAIQILSSLSQEDLQELFTQIDPSALDGLLSQVDPAALQQILAVVGNLELKLPE